jgi:hypothetical protein
LFQPFNRYAPFKMLSPKVCRESLAAPPGNITAFVRIQRITRSSRTIA